MKNFNVTKYVFYVLLWTYLVKLKASKSIKTTIYKDEILNIDSPKKKNVQIKQMDFDTIVKLVQAPIDKLKYKTNSTFKTNIDDNGIFTFESPEEKVLQHLEIDLKINLSEVEVTYQKEQEDNKSKHIFKSKFLEEVGQLPEYSKFETFTGVENTCLLLRKYFQSFPFNIPEMAKEYKMRERYKNVSYRTMVFRLLQETTIFSEEKQNEIKEKIGNLRSLKEKLNLLIPAAAQEFGIIKDSKKELIENAIKRRNKVKNLMSDKRGYIREQEGRLQKLKKATRKHSSTVKSKIKYFPSLVEAYNSVDRIIKLLENCDDVDCMDMINKVMIKSSDLNNLSDSFLVLVGPVEIMEKLTQMIYLLEYKLDMVKIQQEGFDSSHIESETSISEDKTKDSSISNESTQSDDIDDEIEPDRDGDYGRNPLTLEKNNALSNLKRSIQKNTTHKLSEETDDASVIQNMIKETKLELKLIQQSVSHHKNDYIGYLKNVLFALKEHFYISEYQKYLNELKTYEDTVNQIFSMKKEVITWQDELDSLEFLLTSMQDSSDLDFVVSKDYMDELEEQYGHTTSDGDMVSLLTQEIKKPENSLVKDKLSQVLTKTKDLNFNKENLTKANTIQKLKRKLLMEISEIENYIDNTFAELISIANKIHTRVDDETYDNVSKCFSDLELGLNFYQMAKFNLIMHYDTFIDTYLSSLEFSEMREFALVNYAVLIEKDKLEDLSMKYKIRRNSPLEEEEMRRQLIMDFSSRYSFLIEIFRNKVKDMKFWLDSNIAMRHLVIMRNYGEKAKWMVIDKFNEFKTQVVDKGCEHISSYIIDQIEFIKDVPILADIAEKGLNLLLQTGISFLKKILLDKVKHKGQYHFYRLKNLLLNKIFKATMEPLNYEDILEKYKWIRILENERNLHEDVNKTIFDINPQEKEQQNTADYRFFNIYRIEEKYNEVIKNPDNKTNSYFLLNYLGNINLFNPVGYLLSTNRLMMDDAVFEVLKKKYQVNSLQDIHKILGRRMRLM